MYNLFAYCGNDPVMGSDPSGNFWYYGNTQETSTTSFLEAVAAKIDKKIIKKIPDYVPGSLKITDGPKHISGLPGVNDIKNGTLDLLEKIPGVGPGLSELGKWSINIPEKNQLYFFGTAEFKHYSNESENVDIILYDDGSGKIIRRDYGMTGILYNLD